MVAMLGGFSASQETYSEQNIVLGGMLVMENYTILHCRQSAYSLDGVLNQQYKAGYEKSLSKTAHFQLNNPIKTTISYLIPSSTPTWPSSRKFQPSRTVNLNLLLSWTYLVLSCTLFLKLLCFQCMISWLDVFTISFGASPWFHNSNMMAPLLYIYIT